VWPSVLSVVLCLQPTRAALPPPIPAWCPCRSVARRSGGSAGGRPLLAEAAPRLRNPLAANERRLLPAGPGCWSFEIDDVPLVGPGPSGRPPPVVQASTNRNPCRLSDPPATPGPVRCTDGWPTQARQHRLSAMPPNPGLRREIKLCCPPGQDWAPRRRQSCRHYPSRALAR